MIDTYETQKSITAWGQRTFGHPHPAHVAARMTHEMFELDEKFKECGTGPLAQLSAETLAGLAGECADLGIMLLQIVELLGLDFQTIIDAKMKINRGREWHLDKKTGTMRHVEGT